MKLNHATQPFELTKDMSFGKRTPNDIMIMHGPIKPLSYSKKQFAAAVAQCPRFKVDLNPFKHTTSGSLSNKHRLINKLADLVHSYIVAPSLDTYYKFVANNPFPSIVVKLQLVPAPGLTIKMWSLYASLKLYESGHHYGISLDGQVVEVVGQGVCWEDQVLHLGVTAADYVVDSGTKHYVVDSTSATDVEILFSKQSTLVMQMSTAKVYGCPIVVLHDYCSIDDPKFELGGVLGDEYAHVRKVGETIKGKSDVWKRQVRRVTENTITDLMRKAQFEIDTPPAIDETTHRAHELYKSGTVADKMKWINGADDKYCNKNTLQDLIGGFSCSNLGPTLMYSGAVQFSDLAAAQGALDTMLRGVNDPLVDLLLRTNELPSGNVYWLSKNGHELADRRLLDLEQHEICFPPSAIALVENTKVSDSEVRSARMVMNPGRMGNIQTYMRNAMAGKDARVQTDDATRCVTVQDVYDAESNKNELVAKLSEPSSYPETLSIWVRKQWINNMSPIAQADLCADTLNRLKDIKLGNAINHEFEIANIISNTLHNTKKHTFTLVRNGHNFSYSFIKCSSGGGAFKNCPVKVIWASDTDVPTRHDDFIALMDDGLDTTPKLYLRTTKWHNVDTRTLTWGINHAVVVESRISTILATCPDIIEGPEDLVLCSLPTLPNTQDFSKLAGPLRNAIDSLESIESEEKGATDKMLGLTVSSWVELWYTMDYLTTYMIGRFLHRRRMFDIGGPLKNDETGTIWFKFPEIRACVSDPEIMTNFRNAFHHVVKNKVNKLGPEARDFLAIVGEMEIYESKRQKLEKGEMFGCSLADWQNIQQPVLDEQQVIDSVTAAWKRSSGTKLQLRYQWSIWYQITAVLLDIQMNAHESKDETSWWLDMFSTTVDEYLLSTGSMEMGRIDMSKRQSRRKSTSVYELMTMILHDTDEVPTFLKSAVAEMVRNQSECVMSMGVVVLYILRRGIVAAKIRILDKDQVEGEREISALDVMSMVLSSLHEKAWSRRCRHHPVDQIMARDKAEVLRNLWNGQRDLLSHDETLAASGTDCSRYGPNQDMEQMALNAVLLMEGTEGVICQLACQALFYKCYKPPETLGLAYQKAVNSYLGIDSRGGVLNQAYRAIRDHCKEGGLQMRGGMGQGIHGTGGSYSTSMCKQLCNHLMMVASTRLVGVSSAQTSDDGADVYRILKKKKYDTLRWINTVRSMCMSMGNNIINLTKSGIRLTSLELNGIRMYAQPNLELIETLPLFKMMAAKIALPDTMSFVEDCIKANLYSADLVKIGIPSDLVQTNCVHSLMLCYHLHKKWIYFSDAKYMSVPALFGGPIGPCFIETTLTPLASIVVFDGQTMSSTISDMDLLARTVLRVQLLDEELYSQRDTEFGDAPALYKKSVDGLRFTRRPTKSDRKAFEELFHKGFSANAVPNLIFPHKPVGIASTTATFIHKLTTGQGSQSQPNNKWLLTFGTYRKSYSDECIVIAAGSPMSFLTSKTRVSPENLRALLTAAQPLDFRKAIEMCAEKNATTVINSVTSGTMHTAMLEQLRTKFLMVQEIHKAISELHNHRVLLQRGVVRHPLTSSSVRTRRDVRNLEQEIKLKLFLEMGGEPASRYLADEFGIVKPTQSKAQYFVPKAMVLADQYSEVIVEFLTLKDRYVTLRTKYTITDDRSMVAQILKYNMSYTKTYKYDDTELLSVQSRTLKDFVSAFNLNTLEERAILMNNQSVLERIVNLGFEPEPFTLRTSTTIKTVEDLNLTVSDPWFGDQAIFEVSNASQSSKRMVMIAAALGGKVCFKNDALMKFINNNAQPGEHTGTDTVWSEHVTLHTLSGDKLDTVDVVNKVQGEYRHEFAVPVSSKHGKFMMSSPPLKYRHDPFVVSEVPDLATRSLGHRGGSIICKMVCNSAPLFSTYLIDFDLSIVQQNIIEYEDKGHVDGQQVIQSESTGDPYPSMWWVRNKPPLPPGVALGFLGTYGHKKLFRELITAHLTGEDIEDIDPMDSDRTFAVGLTRQLDPDDMSLSPYARLCLHSLRESRPRRPPMSVIKMSLVPSSHSHIIDVQSLDAIMKPSVPMQELKTVEPEPLSYEELADTYDMLGEMDFSNNVDFDMLMSEDLGAE